MTPERHQQISDLYHRVAALPHGQRSSWLDEAAAGDPELRAEVESLLAADEKAGAFLETPALDIAGRLLAEAPLSPPAQVGRYRLLSLLGRGGMGDVYLAEDTALRRNVAVKLLAPGLTSDDRALARFEQEARAASSLNHPNIVTIYESGTAGERRFLAMEFVEGRPLSDWVGRRMPGHMLVPVARQLAQALAVAHAAGIVHRDVKPANVMLRPDGYVKLLDFGVARLAPALADAERSYPGLVTHAGLVIGTPRYMSPEQIRGEPATSASDVFALGAVLHELATTKHPSESTSPSAPSLDVRLPSPGDHVWTEPGMADVVGRMLAQDPRARPTAAEVEAHVRSLESTAGQELENTSVPVMSGQTGPAAPPTSAAPDESARRSRRPAIRRPAMMAGAAVIAAVALALAGALLLGPSRNRPQPPATPIRFQVFPPPNTTFSSSSASLAISPDGRRLAFTGSESQGELGLWIKSWDSLEARRVPNLAWPGQIFWSPDSRAVAFADVSSGFALKTVDLDRESVQAIPDVRLHGTGIGDWSPRHGIVVKAPDNVLHQVPSGGTAPRRLTTLDPARGETGHAFPSFLPDGRHFIFLATSTEREHDGVAYLAAVEGTEVTRLFKSDSQVVYADPGYLLYMIDDTLLAVPFDTAALTVAGEPRAVADKVERNIGSRRGAFSVSQTGVLAYRQHTETQLVWYHRDGRRLDTIGPPGHYRNPALAPDGRTLAVARLDVKSGAWDIWTIDVERNAAAAWTPEALEDMPVWSPDGAHIAFSSRSSQQRGGAAHSIYRQAASGEGERQWLADIPGHIALYAWSTAGLVYSAATDRGGKNLDLWRLPLAAGPNHRPVPLLETPFYDAFGQPSPDGRWIAYVSDQSGRFEVFAASFPSGQGRWLISVDGGSEPAWRRDGKELFYLSPKRQMMAVPITAGSRLHAGIPQRLFEAAVSSVLSPNYTRSQYAVTADGQRFLINEPIGKGSLSAITVVFNWPAMLGDHPGR
jgi:serine/threonine protein kinase